LPKYYNGWTWHWKKILFWINQKVSHHLAAIIIEITYMRSIQHGGFFRIPYLLKIKYYVTLIVKSADSGLIGLKSIPYTGILIEYSPGSWNVYGIVTIPSAV
jgi:hypothetical protein